MLSKEHGSRVMSALYVLFGTYFSLLYVFVLFYYCCSYCHYQLKFLFFIMAEPHQELQNIKEQLSLVTRMLPVVAELKEAFDH